MDSSSFGRGIGESIVTAIIILVVFAFAFGIFVAWFIPNLWTYLKPIIHAFTV